VTLKFSVIDEPSTQLARLPASLTVVLRVSSPRSSRRRNSFSDSSKSAQEQPSLAVALPLPVAKTTFGTSTSILTFAVLHQYRNRPVPELPAGIQAPRNILNSWNIRTGRGTASFQYKVIGLAPSARSSVTGPQAR